MAIAETRKKLHFVPFDIKKGRDVDTSPAPTINVKEGALRFSKALITELNLNGKFVKFYYDGIKNVIGFQYKTTAALQSMKDGTWKMVNQNPKNGCWTVSVRKMMNSQFGEKQAKKNYGALPVIRYREGSDIMDRGDVYYFVELVDEVEKKTGGVSEELNQ